MNTCVIPFLRFGLAHETHRFHTGHYSHPARGSTRGYPLCIRTTSMSNLDGSYTRAAICIGYSIDTIRRWERKIMTYRMAGGR